MLNALQCRVFILPFSSFVSFFVYYVDGGVQLVVD